MAKTVQIVDGDKLTNPFVITPINDKQKSEITTYSSNKIEKDFIKGVVDEKGDSLVIDGIAIIPQSRGGVTDNAGFITLDDLPIKGITKEDGTNLVNENGIAIIPTSGGGTSNYDDLTNQPIKNLDLKGSTATMLASIEDGAYIVRTAGTVKTAGGYSATVGVGNELIVRTLSSGLKQVSMQAGSGIVLFDNNTKSGGLLKALITSDISTSITSSSTNSQVAGAKAVYDLFNGVATTLASINDEIEEAL